MTEDQMEHCPLNNPTKIAIVGGGAAGYFAAAAIKRNCENVDVTVIYDPATPHIGVGESIAWNGPGFMSKYLGLHNDFSWIKKSGSTFKLAAAWQGFDGTDQFYYSTSPLVTDSRVVERSIWNPRAQDTPVTDPTQYSLYDLWLHVRARGSLNSNNPQQNFHDMFWFVHGDKCPIDSRGNWSALGHSYHINAETIKDVIHDLVGRPAGVKELAMKIADVELNANGSIKCLCLDNGQKHTADLYIDCTGFAKVLVKKLPYTFEPCDEYFNNTAIVGPSRYVDHSRYTGKSLMAAMKWGWRFSVPMKGRSGEGYVFNSSMINNVDSIVEEYEQVTGRRDTIKRVIRWTPGYLKESFVHNCIALGISQGFSEPFDANGFTSTLRHIEKIVDYIKQDHQRQWGWQAEFNRHVRDISQDVIFRVQTAFHLAQRNDTDYWRELKVAAAKFQTRERLVEAIFDPRRRRLPGDANDLPYSQNVFVNQAIYNGIEIPRERCLLNISEHTERLAVEFFEHFDRVNQIKAQAALPITEFYERLYP